MLDNLLYYYIITLLPHLHTAFQTVANILRIVTWNMGYLVLIVACVVCIKENIAIHSAASGICYNYTKRVDHRFTVGLKFENKKSHTACQYQCNVMENCLGISFDRNINICYIGYGTPFYKVIPDSGMDYYTRHGCGTTLAPLCNDTFTITNHYMYMGTSDFDINTLEICKQKCLSFYTSITSQFCYGFDYVNKQTTYRCHLMFNIDNEIIRYEYYTNYKRQKCIPES